MGVSVGGLVGAGLGSKVGSDLLSGARATIRGCWAGAFLAFLASSARCGAERAARGRVGGGGRWAGLGRGGTGARGIGRTTAGAGAASVVTVSNCDSLLALPEMAPVNTMCAPKNSTKRLCKKSDEAYAAVQRRRTGVNMRRRSERMNAPLRAGGSQHFVRTRGLHHDRDRAQAHEDRCDDRARVARSKSVAGHSRRRHKRGAAQLLARSEEHTSE